MSFQSNVNINVGAILGQSLYNAQPLQGWWEHLETFLQPPAANASIGVATNLNWELLGTNTPTATLNSGTGILLTTDANAGDDAVIFPHQDAAQTLINAISWDLSTPCLYDTVIDMTAVAASNTYAGWKLTSTLDLTTDANQIMFYSTNSGNWQIATSIAGTDALVDTGVARELGTTYRLSMISGFTSANGDEQVACFIDGDLVAMVDSPTTGTLKPFYGIEGNTQSGTNYALRIGRQYA